MKLGELQKELARVALAVLALAISVTAFASEAVTVVQRDRKFQTKAIEIKAGDTVRFTNEDPFIHHLFAKSESFSFNSKEQETGAPLDVMFPVKGDFEVRCEIHPKMLLKVHVS